jgi:hypothetical protein
MTRCESTHLSKRVGRRIGLLATSTTGAALLCHGGQETAPRPGGYFGVLYSNGGQGELGIGSWESHSHSHHAARSQL